jgi:hypothetical protein
MAGVTSDPTVIGGQVALLLVGRSPSCLAHHTTYVRVPFSGPAAHPPTAAFVVSRIEPCPAGRLSSRLEDGHVWPKLCQDRPGGNLFNTWDGPQTLDLHGIRLHPAADLRLDFEEFSFDPLEVIERVLKEPYLFALKLPSSASSRWSFLLLSVPLA